MNTKTNVQYHPYGRKTPYVGKYFLIRVDSKIQAENLSAVETYLSELQTDRKRVFTKHGRLNIAFTLVKPMSLNKLLAGIWNSRRSIQIIPGRNACMDAFLDSIIEDLPFKPLRNEIPDEMVDLRDDISVIDMNDKPSE